MDTTTKSSPLEKPPISEDIRKKWQRVVDIMAKKLPMLRFGIS
jgi:hypothetical protein